MDELHNLLEELRETIDNELFWSASDYEIIKALIECAIINSRAKKEIHTGNIINFKEKRN